MSVIAVFALIAGIPCYHAAHPTDMVEADVRGLPADADYYCIACDDGKAVRLLDVYDQSLVPFDHYVPRIPEGTWGEVTPALSSDFGLRWKPGLRYAVISRDVRGGWRRWWIPADKVQSGPAQGKRSLSLKVLVIPPAASPDIPTPAELSALGIRRFLPGSPEALQAPGLLPGAEGTRVAPRPESLVERIKSIEESLEDGKLAWACTQASQLCLSAIPSVAAMESPTPEQQSAARELEGAYRQFVTAATKGPIEAREVLKHWNQLLGQMSGKK